MSEITSFYTIYDERVPQSIKSVADNLTLDYLVGLREDAGVDSRTINGVEHLFCDGYCPKHADWREISVLWVTRNDLDSWVWSQGKRSIKKQPMGSVIVLDIERDHGLNCKGGKRGRRGIWAAAIVARLTEYPSLKELKNLLDEFILDPKTVLGEEQ
jgi:hypothetical protein